MAVLKEGILGRLYYYETATIDLDANGSGSLTVSFPAGFPSTPNVFLVSRQADAGTYTAADVTKSGFTLNITTSDIKSESVEVIFLAHEKL